MTSWSEAVRIIYSHVNFFLRYPCVESITFKLWIIHSMTRDIIYIWSLTFTDKIISTLILCHQQKRTLFSAHIYIWLYTYLTFNEIQFFEKKKEEETVFSKWGKKNDSLFIKKEKGRLMHKFWKYFPVFTSECVRKRKESKRKKGKNEIKRTR